MASRRKSEKLDIPDSAWAPKPFFKEQPSPAIVDEIRQHLRAGLPTYLWRGHTHSPPPAGAAVEYLAEFDLDVERAAPCPICSPLHRKFYRNGLVAWFPETATISMIGPDCFQRISGGHNEALARFRAREKAERDRAYLVDNAPLVGEFLRITSKNLKHARRIEGLRAWVNRQLKERGIDLWPHIRSGTLFIEEVREEATQDRSGELRIRKVTTAVPKATIRGFRFYDPSWAPASSLLDKGVDLLERCIAIPQEIEAMTDDERNVLAGRISQAFASARAGHDALAEVIDGISTQTTATLRNWSAAGGPIKIYIRRRPGELEIGRSKDDAALSRPPDGLDFAVDRLPALRSKSPRAGD